jgi:tetrahydromethanopterin S-methyltransferase subunit F
MKRYLGDRRYFGLESADWSVLVVGVVIAGLLVLVM